MLKSRDLSVAFWSFIIAAIFIVVAYQIISLRVDRGLRAAGLKEWGILSSRDCCGRC
jgi:hypothetical protein